MGNTFSCWEKEGWDAHPEIAAPYAFPEGPSHDMSQPLSHYFISSGHNSYLTSDQLVGAAGTSTIKKSLEAGCRVIELDCYSSSQGPVCKHGGTATSPVKFEECVVAIKESGFKSSPYPVIITMENHADAEGQLQMVEILRRVLGPQLFVPESADKQEWKSPQELSHKFLIRTNTGHACPELKSIVYIANTKFKGYSTMNALENVTSSSLAESAVESLGKKLDVTKAAGKVLRKGSKGSSKRPMQSSPSLIRGRSPLRTAPGHAKVKTKEEEEEEEEIDAISPSAFTLEDAYKYARRHLLRVYPAGWRVASTNYDPTLAWNLGASFVALNWQEWDKALWINQAKFRVNRNSGYVLKPDWMLQGKQPTQPSRVLKVHVYSAYLKQGGMNCLCNKDDLLVSLEVRGWYEDHQKLKTDYVQDSGRLRVEEDFLFEVKCPELAVLLVVLQDHDINANDSLGYFSLPLATLQPGRYRLPLVEPGTGKELPVKDAWVKVALSWEEEEAAGTAPEPRTPERDGGNPLRDH